jgi:energy-coupling factor transporter transmembrane protein EcfT
VRRLHPATSLALVAYVTPVLYTDHWPLAAVVCLVSSAYLGPLISLSRLYLALASSLLLVASLFYGPLEALVIASRVTLLAIAFSTAIASVDPSDLAYALSRLGAPPTAAFFPLMALRMADYLRYVLSETLAALAGRGIRGAFKVALRAPIPLVIHSFNASAYVAEALYFKKPVRPRTWLRKPTPTRRDYTVALLTMVATAAYYALTSLPS